MGWCSATEIFDDVAAALLEKGKKAPTPEEVLGRLIDVLEDMDWDCQQDSAYYDHPLVQALMQKKHPRWFEER